MGIKAVFGVFILTATLGAIGCSGSSGGNGGNSDDPAQSDYVTELGYSPNQRWPEQGAYSYDFSTTYNGVKCEAVQSFAAKATFCMGLQDAKLNKQCALVARKSAFSADCGNDFQEINIPNNFWRSGYDTRLKKHCETARPDNDVFLTEKQRCSFLKNEGLHKNCFWEDRFDAYQSHKCRGDFSEEPLPVGGGEPTPVPTPILTPAPTPAPVPVDPLEDVAIVKELRSEGFKIEVHWDAIRDSGRYRFPGDMPWDQKLALFWLELENNRAEILSRKNKISEIHVTSYTIYRSYSDRKILSLDFEASPGQLEKYFPLLDQLLVISQAAGIDFDFIQSGDNGDEVAYRPLVEVLQAVTANKLALAKIKGLVKTVELENFSSFYSKSGQLNINRKNIGNEFARYVQLLQPLGPFYLWAQSQGIEIESEFDVDKNYQSAKDAFGFLQGLLPHFDKMAKAGMLKEISIYLSSSCGVSYYSNIRSMGLCTTKADQHAVSQAIPALGKLGQFTLESKIPIEVSGSTIGADTVKAISILESLWTKIKSKIAKIKKISVGYETRYYESLKELTIGYQTSLKDSEKIVDQIK